MSNSVTFIYSALKGPRSFRLLHFTQDADDTQPLDCTIHDFDRGSDYCPPYTALSYAWGNVQTTMSITLNGHRVSITENLHQALLHLRRHRPYALLWVDALCIDQTNPSERGHQVSQMRAIYSDASNVISWLGQGTDTTDRLFLFLRNHHYSCTVHDGAGTCGFIADRELADALQYLEERPYWHRIWVIQEIVVATSLEVMSGHESVMWSIFVKFWPLVCGDHFKKTPGMNRRLTPFGHMHLSVIVPLIAWPRTDIDVSHALELTGLSRATDRRDKVYALLGLVDRGAGRYIVVDYTMSACRVFLAATQAIVEDWSEVDADESKQEKLETLLSQIDTEPSSRQRFTNFCAGSSKPIPECRTIAYLRYRIRFLLGHTERLKLDIPNDDGTCDGETCGSWVAMYKAATIHKYPKYQSYVPFIPALHNAAAGHSFSTPARKLKPRQEAPRKTRANTRQHVRKKRNRAPYQV